MSPFPQIRWCQFRPYTDNVDEAACGSIEQDRRPERRTGNIWLPRHIWPSIMGDTMRTSGAILISAAFVTLGFAGCSDSGILTNPLTTQSINTAQAVPAAAPDPSCHALAQRIQMLREDGLTERLEKASVGKSATVSVKRASLGQAAELDKANAEFQAKCAAPGLRIAQTAPQAAAGAAAATPAANSAQVVSAATPPAQGHIAPPVIQQKSP